MGGGAGGRAYGGQAGQRAEGFVPHAYGREGGERLYRTGDVGRYLADGNIEYLGRVDEQVKVRGYRIELGEVEAALREHEAVRECVVVAREDAGGDKRLVAYFVAADGEGPTAGELRGFVGRRVPEYMVPSAFVPVQGWPLTPSGKVDRRALPAPEQQ